MWDGVARFHMLLYVYPVLVNIRSRQCWGEHTLLAGGPVPQPFI